MAYEHKPGTFSLFKNDRKESDRHPDYKGDGMDNDGNAIWVSAWLKDGAKGKFMSCQIKRKDEVAQQGAAKVQQAAKPAAPADDWSDTPF
jgi:hypothetical protein